jgi:hypothetical protein
MSTFHGMVLNQPMQVDVLVYMDSVVWCCHSSFAKYLKDDVT